MSVFFSKDVIAYLEELVQTLYDKEYFGFLDSANNYVDKIIDEVEATIHLKRHHLTPKPLQRYGKYFIKITNNKTTTWYVFFDKKETNCLVKYITNNHVSPANFINGL